MQLPPLVPGTLVRRYKRFLADVELDSGQVVVAHCPSPGAMTGMADAGMRVHLSQSTNPKRKLAWTWELVEPTGDAGLALVNSLRVNAIVGEGLRAGLIPGLRADEVKAEVRLGDSRIDFVLQGAGQRTWVEVKCLTLSMGDGLGAFPDSRTKRGQRHVEELALAAQQGDRAVLLFFVARGDVNTVTTADHVDPDYGMAVREAQEQGVEVRAVAGEIGQDQITVGQMVPVVLDSQ